jgi:hypothetical protein
MKYLARMLMRCSIASTVGLVALFWSGDVQMSGQSSIVSSADARIGRPLTPMSYAGVARRTTRRAVAVGAYGAAAYGGAVAVAPYACRQVVNAYGQIVRVCP